MATTRSKKSGDSKPVEKKQVEAPKAKEVKEAPKSVEKKQVEVPKAKEAPVPVEKKTKNLSFEITEHDIVEGDNFKGKVVWISSAMSSHFDNDVVCIRLDSGKKIRKIRKEIKKVN